MSYLDGFIGGLGQGAREISHNMLEAQLKKYESASRIWQAMAQDENYHPAIRQKFFKNAQDLTNYDPYNRESSKRAQELLKLDPNQEATRAYEAMKLLNVDPESLAMYDQFGYRNPLALEQQKHKFNLERVTEVEQLKGRLKQEAEAEKTRKIQEAIAGLVGGDEPNDPAGNEFRQKQAANLLLSHLFGSRNIGSTLNPPQIAGGLVQQGDSGQITSSPGVMLGGQPFDVSSPTGPIPASPVAYGPKLRLIRGEGGRMQWVAPSVKPQNSGAVQEPIQSATFSQEDAIAGTRASTTTRGYGSSGTPAGPPPVPGTAAPALPTAPVSGSNTLEQRSRRAGYPGMPQPTYADRKYYELNPVERKKIDASFRGVSHVGRIMDLVEKFQVQHGKSPTGPVRGRVNEWLNRIGWGDAINQLTEVGAEVDRGTLPPEAAGAMIDRINDDLAQRAQTITGQGGAAEEFAEIITLTRSLNGLELISMSGSGNGITRLYQMMERALLNPYQDPQLLRGHGRGVMFLFSEPIKRWMQGTGRGWNDLDPDTKRVIEQFGLASGMPGYQGGTSPQDIIVPDRGPMKGKTLYKWSNGNYYELPEKK